MEDVAEEYVTELINRNMIQIELLSTEGHALMCRVHDLVRDLAIEKAMEQKVLGIFDSSKHHSNPFNLLQGQPRHAIYNGPGKYLKLLGPNSDNMKVRSLAVTKSKPRLGLEEIKMMCTRFKYLKVLDLTDVAYSQGIPKEIGDLVLLKFLGLMYKPYGKATAIPPSIGKLKKLQSLIGPGCYQIPKEICELKEIRHLSLGTIEGKLNIGSDQSKLRTLKNISYEDWICIDTINWTNLHTLFIESSGEGEEGYNFGSIANLTNLQTLRLRMHRCILTIQPLWSCKHLKCVDLLGWIKDPAELSYLPHSVTDLRLFYTEFTKDPMPNLGRLSNLTALYLHNTFERSYAGHVMVCSADAFPCLHFLTLEYLRLKEFQVDDGALPCLKACDIVGCDFLAMDKISQRITSLPPIPKFYWTDCLDISF